MTPQELKNLYKVGGGGGGFSQEDWALLIDNMGGGGVSSENGIFTLSNDGIATINGGAPFPLPEILGVYSMIIPTLKKLKVGIFSTLEGMQLQTGQSDGIINFCSFNQINIFFLMMGADGWRAKLGIITDTNFEISLVREGFGVAISGQWIGTM